MTWITAFDPRLAIRSLRRSPGFTVVAGLTLALGITVTTTIASVADHVLVRGLPFRESRRLVMMLEGDRHGALRTPSAPTSRDWSADPTVAQALDGVTFIRGDGVSLDVGDVSETVGCAFVTPEFFPLLGARALRGRVLGPDDHRRGAPAVAVLSHKLWISRFSGDPAIVGRIVRIDSVPTTIVGVLPTGAVYPPFADLWMSVSRYTHSDVLERRGMHADSRTMGRLRPGVDSARAVTLMRTVGTRLASAYPAEQAGWMPAMVPMQTEIVGNVQPMLLALAGTAGVILLLVCANVAGLLFARGLGRTRELAVRRALGASRGRVLAELLTESLVLALAGGIVGALLTAASLGLVKRFVGSRLPRVDELTVDWRVLAIAASVTVLCALLCGLWPAVRASGERSMEVLRASAFGSVGVRSDARVRRALVTLQFALALALLAGAGLLLQSFRRAAAVRIGFDPSGLVALRVRPPNGAYSTPEAAAKLYVRLMGAARAVPGVVDAAFINHAPFGAASINTTLSIPGRATLDSSNQIFYRTVSDSYLRTMRMMMTAGRWFDETDIRSGTAAFVINEAMARRYWRGQDAVGQHMTVTRASQGRKDFGQPIAGTIIGVVADVHQLGQDLPPAVEVYVPFTLETWPWGSLIVRTRDGAGSIPALARAVRSVDSRLVAAGPAGERNFGDMESLIASTLQTRKFSTSLVAAVAACALLLAAIGMYGVVSYSVTQRTQEIGVRKALGATDGQIGVLLMRDAFRVVALGALLGGAGMWAAARLMRSLLFETGIADPAVYVASALVLAGVAFLATYLPTRRAMRLAPTVALRSD